MLTFTKNKRRNSGTYSGWLSEKIQDMESKKTHRIKRRDIQKLSTYDRIFVKPWSLKTGAFIISGIFVLLMGITKAGWGASTPYGLWFGKFLMGVGVSSETISNFAHMPAKPYLIPFF